MTKTTVVPAASGCPCCLEENSLIQSSSAAFVPMCNSSAPWMFSSNSEQNLGTAALQPIVEHPRKIPNQNQKPSIDIRSNVEIFWFDGLVYFSIYKGHNRVTSIKVEFEDHPEICMKTEELYGHGRATQKQCQANLVADNLTQRLLKEVRPDVPKLQTTHVSTNSKKDSRHLNDNLESVFSPPTTPVHSSDTEKQSLEKPLERISLSQDSSEEQKPFHCSLQKESLQFHKAKEHSIHKVHSCQFCDRTFSTSREYHRHMKKHNPQKVYKCTYCAKMFKRYAYLKCHTRIHTGEKPFRCTDCSMCFTQKTHLIDHRRRTHTKERPFQCDICGNCFVAATDLKQHILVHTGLKRHKCNVCTKSFSQACNLKRHKMTHTGEKPFVCETCGKQFTRLQYLKEHSNIHA